MAKFLVSKLRFWVVVCLLELKNKNKKGLKNKNDAIINLYLIKILRTL